MQTEAEINDVLDSFSDTLPSLSQSEEKRRFLAHKFYSYGKVFALYEDDTLVGFAAFYDNNAIQKVAYLSMIAVKAGYRRKGIGKIILNYVVQYAVESGMRILRLEVNKSNLNARNFYYSYGFQLFEENENSYILEKSIEVL